MRFGFAFILACLIEAHAGGYFESLGVEMDEASMLRLNVAGYSEASEDGRFRISVPTFSFAADGDSPYSKTRFSPSLSFLYFPMLFLKIQAEKSSALNVAWYALSVVNSSYYFAPGGHGNLRGSDAKSLTGAFYVKNNVDPFLFNERRWMKVSPGAGMNLIYINYPPIPVAFDFSIGVVNAFETDFSGRWRSDPGVHFRFAMAGD